MKVALIAVVALLVGLPLRAQLVGSYNPDTLTVGSSVTDVQDTSGNENNLSSYFGNGDAPTAGNSLSAFNGHTYIDFGNSQALVTSALFTGNGNRTMAVVYALPNGDNGNVNPIVGESDGGGTAGAWFVLQARSGGATGDPYLAGYFDDVTSGQTPVANQLTFAVATYSNSGNLESLYWAYGVNGNMQSASATFSLNTQPNGSFLVGADYGGEPSDSDMDIGKIQVYDNAVNTAGAQAIISNFQSFYAESVPEPSTYAMMLGSLALLAFCVRRKLALL
jgi:hypothetical protein